MTSWTAADIPNLAGRTAVVTGASAGVGLETALRLAERGRASYWPAGMWKRPVRQRN
ncbi:hypothetical protein [Nocardia sp. NPDC046763]|uniref:hypothetical protein n=1 Tax=Nocardia sp. NPDC046763 TaxID=3155256 RepID=UPI0033F8C63B